MASAKQQNGNAPSAPTEFDWSKFAPQGVKPENIVIYEGLTPIYAAERALEENWDPAVGWCYGTELLKTIRANTDSAYTPLVVRLQLTSPTKAQSGPPDARKTVELKAGDDILIPVGASLRVQKKLENACIDPKQVYLLGFRVTGTMKSDYPNDMYVIEVADFGARQPRTGRFAFPSNEVVLLDQTTRHLTSGGAYVDSQGVVSERATAAS